MAEMFRSEGAQVNPTVGLDDVPVELAGRKVEGYHTKKPGARTRH
jgi:hypothetical protein